jgi:hypothetical protein
MPVIVTMLIFAEGTVNEPVSDVERAAVRAWLGPMVDEGFIQSGYINMARDRVRIVVSSPDIATAIQRLSDLPVVWDGAVSFSTIEVSALRFR